MTQSQKEFLALLEQALEAMKQLEESVDSLSKALKEAHGY